jgi:transposase
MLVADQIQILLCSDPIDMRKGADGLAGIVRDVLKDEPLSGKLFVFQSKGGDRVKLLYWHYNGFAIWSKRIQHGRFRFPKGSKTGIISMTRSALRMILEGIDFESIQKKKSA